MRLLVIGSTGGTGRELVTQGLERGHEVTAFARRPSKVTIRHPRLTVLQGDVLDYPSVEAAVRGQNAVLSALGHKRWILPSTILSAGTRNIIQAMESLEVRRLICVTSLGVADTRGLLGVYYTFFVIPFLLYFYFRDKELQERSIRESSLEWVIVRPGALTNGPKRDAYRHGDRLGHWLRTVRVSRADVADFMLNQLADTPYLHSAPGVCW